MSSLLRWLRKDQPGMALAELVVAMPLLLTMVFGIIGLGRILQADAAVKGVAREAARAAALADTATDASSRGLARGQAVAAGYGLTNGSLKLTLDPGTFDRGGQVTAQATYTVQLGDLPLMHWVRKDVSAQQHEPIDIYRSRWAASPSP